MPQHGRSNENITANTSSTSVLSNGAPLWTSSLVKNGGKVGVTAANAHSTNTTANGNIGIASKLYENTTVGVFIPGKAVGIFGVTPGSEQTNRTNGRTIAHAGWNEITIGTGPITGATIATRAGTMKNNETITVKNTASVGVTNAILTVTTNSSGNAVSLAVTNPGSGFTNATNLVIAYNREKFVSSIAASGTTGYDNTDFLVISNSAVGVVNAKATFSTNTSGGLDGGTITVSNAGFFANNIGAGGANLVLTVVNSSGGTTTAGNSTTSGFTVTMANSSGTLTINYTFGGRAGRVQWETLVAMGSLGAQTSVDGMEIDSSAAANVVHFANTAQEGLWIPNANTII